MVYRGSLHNCVNLGSLELQAVGGEITNLNVDNLTLMLYLHWTILMEMMEALPIVTMMEWQSKQMLVTVNKRQSKHLSLTKKGMQSKHLLHAVWSFLTTKPILTPLKLILMTSFGCPFQVIVSQGISFWVDLKDPTQWGWLRQRRKALWKITERKGSHSLTKNARL